MNNSIALFFKFLFLGNWCFWSTYQGWYECVITIYLFSAYCMSLCLWKENKHLYSYHIDFEQLNNCNNWCSWLHGPYITMLGGFLLAGLPNPLSTPLTLWVFALVTRKLERQACAKRSQPNRKVYCKIDKAHEWKISLMSET